MDDERNFSAINIRPIDGVQNRFRLRLLPPDDDESAPIAFEISASALLRLLESVQGLQEKSHDPTLPNRFQGDAIPNIRLVVDNSDP